MSLMVRYDKIDQTNQMSSKRIHLGQTSIDEKAGYNKA